MAVKKLDTTVRIGPLTFKNPVLAASGTYGYAKEFEQFYPVKTLGGIVTKTITVKPRTGNPPQRIYETPSGMMNAIGLQNVGADAFLTDKLPYLASLGIPVIVSVMGYSIDEFRAVIGILEKGKGISGYELNLSCPNVAYGTQAKVADRPAKMFAHDAAMIESVVKAAREETKKPIIAKLGPDVSDIGMMARAAESAGADAVSLINTFIALAIDIKKRRPYIKNVTGGLSGPCIRPIAVRLTWEAARAVQIPVIGMGGIATAKDALEFIIAGASLVQVGTMNFVNPMVCPQVISGIEAFLKEEKIASVKELIGTLNCQK